MQEAGIPEEKRLTIDLKFDKNNGTKVIFVTPMRRMTFRKNGTLSDNLQPYADAMAKLIIKNLPESDSLLVKYIKK